MYLLSDLASDFVPFYPPSNDKPFPSEIYCCNLWSNRWFAYRNVASRRMKSVEYLGLHLLISELLHNR